MLGYYRLEDRQTPPSFSRSSNADIWINKERKEFLQLEPVSNSEPTYHNRQFTEARFTNRDLKYREEEENQCDRRRNREPADTYREDERKGRGRHTNREPVYREDERTSDREWEEIQARYSNMSNPFLEKGYTMPYQISQNKYREQVFGYLPRYNYPQQKPEPLAGRNIPPRNYPPGNYSPKFQNTPRNQYDSPRQTFQQHGQTHHHQQQFEQRPQQYEQNQYQQDQRTYRSGRPDLGNETFQGYSVPYPQEPLRHRQNVYEPPPEIGYDPHDGQAMMRPHPGWVLLLRFSKEGEVNVRRALTFASKHIESDGGRILGLARAHSVRVREGGDSWVTFGGMRYFGGGNWDVQQSPQNDTTYSVLAIYFPSLSRAIQWFDRDSCFKQKDFPPPYTTDCIALPLNSSVDTKYCKTLVLTEYPRISHAEYFRDKFSVPTQEMMSKRFNATPYVVKATSIPTDDPRQRVARHLRGSWIKRNSIITLSLFGSLNETHRYFTDAEYLRCKEAQDKVSAPTTVVMDLEDWRL